MWNICIHSVLVYEMYGLSLSSQESRQPHERTPTHFLHIEDLLVQSDIFFFTALTPTGWTEWDLQIGPRYHGVL